MLCDLCKTHKIIGYSILIKPTYFPEHPVFIRVEFTFFHPSYKPSKTSDKLNVQASVLWEADADKVVTLLDQNQ
jgi:hypothetical protein